MIAASHRLGPWILGMCLCCAVPACIRDDRAGHSPAATQSPISGDLPSGPELQQRLDESILLVLQQRRLKLETHAAWQIIHGAMAFQRAFPVEQDGRLVSALDYALSGGRIRGWDFDPGIVLDPETGRRGLRAVLQPGSKEGQGHPDQWLGYLAECGLSADATMHVGNQDYTVADLVAQAEWDVPRNAEQEFSWTLMALTSYRPTTYQWTASDGQSWNIEKLVGIEVGHDLNASACGGTHRLYGLSMALNRHVAQGGAITGEWQRADAKIQEAIAVARETQNADGSFSTNYFARPGTSADLAQSLGTTGHILEFLSLAMTDEQVQERWVRRAALRLCEILQQTKDVELECGALYHATHGLILYRKRLFGPLEFPSPDAP
jgi:hypothetical protein